MNNENNDAGSNDDGAGGADPLQPEAAATGIVGSDVEQIEPQLSEPTIPDQAKSDAPIVVDQPVDMPKPSITTETLVETLPVPNPDVSIQQPIGEQFDPNDVVENPSSVLPPSPLPQKIEENSPTMANQTPEIREEPKQPQAVQSPSDDTNGLPSAVAALSEEELAIAARYYTSLRSVELSQLGVQARKKRMINNLTKIEEYIKSNSGSQVPRIARKLNLSPGLVSHYIQVLVKQGRVRAEGWAASRRFYQN